MMVARKERERAKNIQDRKKVVIIPCGLYKNRLDVSYSSTLPYICYQKTVPMMMISVASSMKKSSIERARACSKMKIRAQACSSIRKFYMIELLPGNLTKNGLFLPKFAYFQKLVCSSIKKSSIKRAQACSNMKI